MENPDFRSKQKNLMETLILSFRRATNDLLSDLKKRVFQTFAAPWADGWIRASPNHAFDTCLSNAAFYDTVFPCGLADKFSKATRHAHDIPNLKIPLDIIYLRVICLEENQSFII